MQHSREVGMLLRMLPALTIHIPADSTACQRNSGYAFTVHELMQHWHIWEGRNQRLTMHSTQHAYEQNALVF